MNALRKDPRRPFRNGADSRLRTGDLEFGKLALRPTELRPHLDPPTWARWVRPPCPCRRIHKYLSRLLKTRQLPRPRRHWPDVHYPSGLDQLGTSRFASPLETRYCDCQEKQKARSPVREHPGFSPDLSIDRWTLRGSSDPGSPPSDASCASLPLIATRVADRGKTKRRNADGLMALIERGSQR